MNDKKELIVLDLDNVIINGQSQIFFLNYLIKKKIISLFFYLKIYLWFLLYKLGLEKNLGSIIIYAYSFSKDWKQADLKKIVNDFFHQVLVKRIFAEMAEIIQENQTKGNKLVIISTSIDLIVEKFANYFGIKDFVSTKLEVVGDVFTGKIEGEIVYGENKLTELKKFIAKDENGFKSVVGFADHISDVHLLKFCDFVFVVNPDKKFFKYAKIKKWPVKIFK